MPKRTKPNIIIVYTDQQRYDTLGANGNPLIRTPCLDRLAAEGVNFSRGYVTTPICLPSRVALFTGRYNHTNLSYTNDRPMLAREHDAPTLFKQHGYTTALLGKNHCFTPERLAAAFDHVRQAGHMGFHPPLNDAERRVNEARAGTMQAPFATTPVSPEDDVTGTLFRDARAYVDARRDDGQPFLLWLSLGDPHPPYMVCEPYASLYDGVAMPLPAWVEGECHDKPHRQQAVAGWDRYGAEYPGDRIGRLRRIYWGMVSYIDTELGKLLDHLRVTGLDDNTIVVFTSDHGDYMGDHRMIRKGPHLYEALVHVPLIVRWGHRFPAHATAAMAPNVDIFPTLYELAGVTAPEGIQGRSFAPVLRGESATHRTRIFLEHGGPGRPLQPGDLSDDESERLRAHNGHHLCPTVYRGRVKGVRSEHWKFCMTPGDVDELYDLRSDPHELHNLACDPEHRAVLEEHRRYVAEWLIETEDTLAH